MMLHELSEYTAMGKAKQYMFPEGQRLWGSQRIGQQLLEYRKRAYELSQKGQWGSNWQRLGAGERGVRAGRTLETGSSHDQRQRKDGRGLPRRHRGSPGGGHRKANQKRQTHTRLHTTLGDRLC